MRTLGKWTWTWRTEDVADVEDVEDVEDVIFLYPTNCQFDGNRHIIKWRL